MDEFKIRVKSPEHSARIQRLLFRNGWTWLSGATRVIHEDKPYLFGSAGQISMGEMMDEAYFEDINKREVTYEELKLYFDEIKQQKQEQINKLINEVKPSKFKTMKTKLKAFFTTLLAFFAKAKDDTVLPKYNYSVKLKSSTSSINISADEMKANGFSIDFILNGMVIHSVMRNTVRDIIVHPNNIKDSHMINEGLLAVNWFNKLKDLGSWDNFGASSGSVPIARKVAKEVGLDFMWCPNNEYLYAFNDSYSKKDFFRTRGEIVTLSDYLARTGTIPTAITNLYNKRKSMLCELVEGGQLCCSAANNSLIVVQPNELNIIERADELKIQENQQPVDDHEF